MMEKNFELRRSGSTLALGNTRPRCGMSTPLPARALSGVSNLTDGMGLDAGAQAQPAAVGCTGWLSSCKVISPMKIAGFLLLLAGWLLVLTAVVLLPSPAARGGFVLAGLAVEILGLALAVRAHSAIRALRD